MHVRRQGSGNNGGVATGSGSVNSKNTAMTGGALASTNYNNSSMGQYPAS